MKKLLILLLAAAMVVTCAACRSAKMDEKDSDGVQTQETPDAAETQNTQNADSTPSGAQNADETEDDSKAEAPELIETAPDGEKFAEVTDLSGYDNPNFDVSVKDGAATVTITFAEMWTDYCDPNSEFEQERTEAQRRKIVSDAMALQRELGLSDVTAVYELPCSTWFPGSDANAIVGTGDGRWYYVELTGERTEGVPMLTELATLNGKTVADFSFRTTTYMVDENTMYSGRDFVVAVLSSGSEQIVLEDLVPAE